MPLINRWVQFAVIGAAIGIVAITILSRKQTREVATVQPSVKQSVAVGPLMEIDPTESARAGRERDDNALNMKFCWCPPGKYRMGPARSLVDVELTHGYWLGKFEVTQAQWMRVTGLSLREQRAKDPDQPRPVGDGTMRDHVGEGSNHPIYFVSHTEAEEFCQKLTTSEREAGRLEVGWIYRLPTEAEWEFACRAGTTTKTEFADTMTSEQANFDGSKATPPGPNLHETTAAGKYPANAWGLCDMHGNVWEWCRDGYLATPGGGVDPEESPNSAKRSYRGGCWHNPASLCVATSRAWGNVDDRGSGLGFRLARARAR